MAWQLRPAITGNASSEVSALTVDTGKKIAQIDIILFNPGSSTTTVKVIVEISSTERQLFEYKLAGKETISPVIKQRYEAGTVLKIDPGSGNVNYSVTRLEDDA